jgi:hypothetical protein
MDVSVDEGLRVVDRGMGTSSGGVGIGLEFVGAEEFGDLLHELVTERRERFGLEVEYDLSGHGSVSLLHADDDALPSSTAFGLSMVAPTNVGVVKLDDSSELRTRALAAWPCGSA